MNLFQNLLLTLNKCIIAQLTLFISTKMNKYNKITLAPPQSQKYEKVKSLSKTQGSEQSNEANFTMPVIFNQMIGHGQRSATNDTGQKHYRRRSKRGSFNSDKIKQVSTTFIHKVERKPLTQNFVQDQIDVSLPHPILTLKTVKQNQVSKKEIFRNTRKLETSKSFLTKTDNNRFFSNVNDKKATHRRNLTTFSQKSQNLRTLTEAEKKHLAKMQEISRCFNEQKLYHRLCIYSKQTVKSSLRVYREDLQKLIIQRYGKDRVTTFLDTEYIEDYNSVRKTTNELFKLNQEQVLVLVFLIMDQNADGLVTPGDLINFIGATNEKVLTNPLIMEDLYEIMRYLKKKHERQQSLLDSSSFDYEELTDESLTLMKFRIFKFQKMKSANDQQGRSRRSKLITGRMRDRLFTLKQEKQDFKYNFKKKMNNRINSVIQFILKAKKKKDYDSDTVPIQFAINFQSFKQIFHEKIPRTFVDFLFLLAGVQIPRATYIPIDSTVLIKNVAVKIEIQEEKGLSRFRTMLRNMKSFSEQSSVVYHILLNDSI